jgi:hypothetical protein
VDVGLLDENGAGLSIARGDAAPQDVENAAPAPLGEVGPHGLEAALQDIGNGGSGLSRRGVIGDGAPTDSGTPSPASPCQAASCTQISMDGISLTGSG